MRSLLFWGTHLQTKNVLSDHLLNFDGTAALFDAFDESGAHEHRLDTIFQSGDVGIRRRGKDLAEDTKIGTAVPPFAPGNLNGFGFTLAVAAQSQGLVGDDIGIVGVALIVDISEVNIFSFNASGFAFDNDDFALVLGVGADGVGAENAAFKLDDGGIVILNVNIR